MQLIDAGATLLFSMLLFSGLGLGQQIDETPSPERFALLIGVSNYDDKNITPLFEAENDVASLKKALINNAGFEEPNIISLTSGSSPKNKPTRGRVLTALSTLQKVVDKDGLLLVMFSGHGITLKGRSFLLTEDARNVGDTDVIAETSLPVELMRDWIARIGAKQTIVFLDACRDDPDVSKSVSGNPLATEFVKSFDLAKANKAIIASAVLYATSIGDRAFVDSAQNLGYFTEAIVEGLTGAAHGVEGIITLQGLFDYVQRRVPQLVTQDLPGRRQTPFYEVSGVSASHLIISTTTTVVGPIPDKENDLVFGSRVASIYHLARKKQLQTLRGTMRSKADGTKIYDCTESIQGSIGCVNGSTKMSEPYLTLTFELSKWPTPKILSSLKVALPEMHWMMNDKQKDVVTGGDEYATIQIRNVSSDISAVSVIQH